MSYERAKELFTKYKNEMATDEEKALVEKWLFGYNNEPGELSDEKIESISREVWSRLPQPVLSPIHRLTVWTKVAAAASVILALSFGGYFLLKEKFVSTLSTLLNINNIKLRYYLKQYYRNRYYCIGACLSMMYRRV